VQLVLFNALAPEMQGEFQAAFEKLSAPHLVAQRHPEQTARSALARAAQGTSQARTSLRSCGLGVRISDKFWKKAKERPQTSQKQAGGRERVLDRPELINLTEHHSKETSRYCRTKARHQNAAAPPQPRAQGKAWGIYLARVGLGLAGPG